MTILAIDSSALPLSVAILKDDVMLAEYTITLKLTHSETLMPVLDDVLKRTGVEPEDIDAFATAGGPGSFTGLRIGSATVKGLADALGVPVISVPTLKAMAYNVLCRDSLIVPMMDARRRNVYTGIFEYEGDDLKTILPQCAIPVTELLDRVASINKKAYFLGDGAKVFREEIDGRLESPHFFAPPHLCLQHSGAVAVLASKMFAEGDFTDAGSHRPDYIKSTQAEQEKKEAEKNGTLRELSAGGHTLYT
ncbi:MAG: tRNA (adenosine(37)-N6)-threonylcarbamoyltransferase complex dimerization subunit type 1 TsaB [Lachnospiraceae bacterium]|nr:tRNA (adenosine(37)-N6)-threonylcarbamoyltransferase complex dimerization subunit type 1 TsaB [Lachnospiraceae bacterium]